MSRSWYWCLVPLESPISETVVSALCGRLGNDGAPARNHGAIKQSNIMQPNAELGMNGQMGLPHR